MEHRYYGGARWWKKASRQKQKTKKPKARRWKQEAEECKGASGCHIGGADAGKPNPSQ